MLTLALALALAASLPQDPAPDQPAAEKPAAERPQDGRAYIGSPKPKWVNRKHVGKELAEEGGMALAKVYMAGVEWLGAQMGEPQTRQAKDRNVGITALIGLVLLGDTSTTNSGRNRAELRRMVAFLKELQDAESGALGDPSAPGFLVDQALAVHALSEAHFSDPRPAKLEVLSKAAGALLAARGEDGLWRASSAPEAPVDPLLTGLATYALYAAREAGAEVPDDAFEAVLGWSGEAPVGSGDAGTAALLAARVFAGSSLERSLAGDARVRELAGLIAARIPALETEGEAPKPAAGPALDPVFLYLATLSLYQADNAAWSRLDDWLLKTRALEQVAEGDAAGSWEPLPSGALPEGRVATSALTLLAVQNRRREPALTIMVQ